MTLKDFIKDNYKLEYNTDATNGEEVNGQKLSKKVCESIAERYNRKKDDGDNEVNSESVKTLVKDLCAEFGKEIEYSRSVREAEEKERRLKEKEEEKERRLKEKEEEKERRLKEKEEEKERRLKSLTDKADWARCFKTDSYGRVTVCADNIKLFLLNSEIYKGRLRYNDYTSNLELDGEPLTDDDIRRMRTAVESSLNIYSIPKTEDALAGIKNMSILTYHPVKEYLMNLSWDRTPRIDTVLIDWFGADDNIYVREASRKWMLGAIKRIFQPGCKFDFALMLVGATGIGKSTFCQRLAKVGGFTDKIDILNPKDYVPLLQTNWIVAFDERGSLSKRDNNDIKTFLSAQEDKTRLSYGKNATIYKRHNAFIGTTNDDRFLNDYSVSEERRYWTIKCNSTDKRRIPDTFTGDIVDQLWAEAYYLYKEDTDVDLSLSEEAYELFKEDQKQFKTIEDDQSYMLLDEKLNMRAWDVVDIVDSETFVNIVTNPNLHAGDKQFEIIPVSCINSYLSSQKIPFAPAKLKRVMEELGWEKTKCNVFTGDKWKTTACFRRKESQTKVIHLSEESTPTAIRSYEVETLM